MTYKIELVDEETGDVVGSETSITAEQLIDTGFSIKAALSISQQGN